MLSRDNNRGGDMASKRIHSPRHKKATNSSSRGGNSISSSLCAEMDAGVGA
uniref:Uncharacterized protein n=1 Tax=Physcomitrium patens TaxID=3218 RepID=A0A2K1ING8_PHYPA|nr:hypothetical protein PHYPA_027130 [Physcomitrium patens]